MNCSFKLAYSYLGRSSVPSKLNAGFGRLPSNYYSIFTTAGPILEVESWILLVEMICRDLKHPHKQQQLLNY